MTSVSYPNNYGYWSTGVDGLAVNVRQAIPRALTDHGEVAYLNEILLFDVFFGNIVCQLNVTAHVSDPPTGVPGDGDPYLSEAWEDYDEALIINRNRNGNTLVLEGGAAWANPVSNSEAQAFLDDHQSGDRYSLTLEDGAQVLPISPSLDLISAVMPPQVTIWDEGKIPFEQGGLGNVCWFSLSGYEALGETWEFEPRMRCYVAPEQVWERQRNPDFEFDTMVAVFEALATSGVCINPISIGVEDSVVDFVSGATVPAHVIEFTMLTGTP